MHKSNSISPARQGVIAALVFVPILVPFAAVFGILSANAGLDALQTFMFSALVIAGASQIAALSLIESGAPAIIAITAGLIINLRMMLYSAALSPHFRGLDFKTRALLAYCIVDQTFVLGIQKFDDTPEWNLRQRMFYYFGVASIIIGLWFPAAQAGFYFGTILPPQWDISFALPLAFIALITPALKTLPHMVAAAISIVIGLALHNMPYNSGLLIAAIIAIIVAAAMEKKLVETRINKQSMEEKL